MLGHVGSLVDYSGKRAHTKHSTICVNPAQCTEYQIPAGYLTEGVNISSAILQRILREYKNISKRVILTGNASYIHTPGPPSPWPPAPIAADTRFSLNAQAPPHARHREVCKQVG